MKKVIKSKIFLVMMTMIFCISGTLYAATTYNASDVIYNSSDGSSMNVSDALNELYKSKNGASIIYLGQFSSAQSINVTKIPGYQNLTKDNFIVESITTNANSLSGGGENGTWYSGKCSLSKSYSASTGVFKYSCEGHYLDGAASIWMGTNKVYLVTGTINNM